MDLLLPLGPWGQDNSLAIQKGGTIVKGQTGILGLFISKFSWCLQLLSLSIKEIYANILLWWSFILFQFEVYTETL